MDRIKKEELVAFLKDAIGNSEVLVVAKQDGLTVSQAETLRNKMREADAKYQVAKNRLIKLAIADSPMDGVSDLLTGPTGIAYSADPVAAARVLVDFAKTNPQLEILGGVMGGTTLDKSGVEALSKMPSLHELRGTLAGLMKAPQTKLARVLQAPASKVARVLDAYAKKEEA